LFKGLLFPIRSRQHSIGLWFLKAFPLFDPRDESYFPPYQEECYTLAKEINSSDPSIGEVRLRCFLLSPLDSSIRSKAKTPAYLCQTFLFALISRLCSSKTPVLTHDPPRPLSHLFRFHPSTAWNILLFRRFSLRQLSSGSGDGGVFLFFPPPIAPPWDYLRIPCCFGSEIFPLFHAVRRAPASPVGRISPCRIFPSSQNVRSVFPRAVLHFPEN